MEHINYSYKIGVEFNRSGQVEYFNQVATCKELAIGQLITSVLFYRDRFYQILSVEEEYKVYA